MRLRAGIVLGVMLVGLPVTAAAVQPVISFEPEAVAVSGLTPGGKVVWFGVAREISERTATIVRRTRVLTDEDSDGVVRLELGRDVPFQSIWVAVDLTTGAATLETPEGYPLRNVELPPQSLGRGESGEADWVEDSRNYVEILFVRPPEGAWGVTVGDGGESDDDGAYNGRAIAALTQMRGAGPSPPPAPERFRAGDVVVVIDPNRMEVGLRQFAEVAP
jgi:hypothetical protein